MENKETTFIEIKENILNFIFCGAFIQLFVHVIIIIESDSAFFC